MGKVRKTTIITDGNKRVTDEIPERLEEIKLTENEDQINAKNILEK